ncbi:unnamed protein product [Ophioblennius macclurei]
MEEVQEEVEKEEELSLVVGVSSCGPTPLLWRVQDLRSARRCGVVGALLGSLPRTPRQNGRLGRPLLLLEEEEHLLRERHAAATLPAPEHVGGAELLHHYKQQERQSFSEQSVLALEDRKAALSHALTTKGPESGEGTSKQAWQDRLKTLEQSFTFPWSALAVQISTARAGLSHCSEARAFLQADEPITVQQQPGQNARYQVFSDLRGRGFFLTSAGKFGGDFLVYPGDPLRFHAHFIAVCVGLDESLSLLDVLSVARLGSNVKKTVLLCSPGPNGDIIYTSLQWSGMV